MDCPLSFKASLEPTREILKAGAMPKSIEATRVITSVNSSTAALIVTSFGSPILSDKKCIRIRTPPIARPTPSAPLTSAKTADSVISWRVTRALVAPKAERMAYSLWRAVPLARSRLATLVQEINNTHAAERLRNSRADLLDDPIMRSMMGITSAVRPLFEEGYVCSSRAATSRISLCAWARLTPGLRRPYTSNQRLPRPSISGPGTNGIQTSKVLHARSSSGGRTPRIE